MKQLLFILFAIIVITGCGRKKQIIDGGNDDMGRWEVFLQNDSCYKVWYKGATIVRIQSSANEKAWRDSTFIERTYYMTGRIEEQRSYVHHKDDGVWRTWFETGKEETWSRSENGFLREYKSWFQNGQLKVEGNNFPDKNSYRKEYYENGSPGQEFELDSIGDGKCITYFTNGKVNMQGKVHNYNEPLGIWHRFDSTGVALSDTLFGLKFQ